MYPERDSNPHARRHSHLKTARLPISPPGCDTFRLSEKERKTTPTPRTRQTSEGGRANVIAQRSVGLFDGGKAAKNIDPVVVAAGLEDA